MHALYDLGRQSFAGKQIDWINDTIRVALVKTGAGHYVVNTATDQFLSIIAGADIVATSAALSGKTDTAGTCAAANFAFAAVVFGTPAAGALVIYQDTGSSSTSRLIAYIDDYLGLPLSPNGQPINVVWPGGGIFQL